MAIALGLVAGYKGCFRSLRGHVSEALAETAATKFLGAAEEFNRIIEAEGSNRELHGPVMLVAQREQVRSHAISSLASCYHERG